MAGEPILIVDDNVTNLKLVRVLLETEGYTIRTASHASEPIMPPKDNKVNAKPLSPDELGLLKLWIDQGAEGMVSGKNAVLNWQPLPIQWHLDAVKSTNPESLLREANEAIRGNLQARASAVIHRYGELGHDPRPAFDLLLRYAVSEDGSLHAEKFYRTASEEFNNS